MTDRQPLLLLHGALGASDQFAPLLPALSGSFELHTMDFEGHGTAPGNGRPYRIEHFVGNVLRYLDDREIRDTHIFGYSMGGFVALRLGLAAPSRVRSIATLGTVLRWNPEVADRELKHLNPDDITAKVPRFARLLADRHSATGWETVVAKTRELLMTLAAEGGIEPAAVRALPHPVRIMAGDTDASVDLAHSQLVARAIPRGELEVLPGTPHPLERVRPELLARSLQEFIGGLHA